MRRMAGSSRGLRPDDSEYRPGVLTGSIEGSDTRAVPLAPSVWFGIGRLIGK
jgi:hypothetical protein